MKINRQTRERLSRLRQEAFGLFREGEKLLKELLHPPAMIAGSFYQMYKKCGRPSCRCARGRLHGPFAVLSTARGGRRSTRSVPCDQSQLVRKRAEAYRSFQGKRARLVQIMGRMDRIVKEVRDARVQVWQAGKAKSEV